MVPSFVRVGAAGLEELGGDGSSKFVKLKAGKPMEIVPLTGLDGIISFNQHSIWLDEGSSPIFPCFGAPWCPGEIIGDKAKFRALLLCVLKEDPDTEMILPMGMSIFKQLVAVEEALGSSMKGQVLRVTRTGEGMSTKYSVMPTGRRVKISGDPETNLMEHIGPTTPEEAIALLEKSNLWTDEHQEEYDRKRAAAKKKAKAAPVVEEDDDEDDAEEAAPSKGVDFAKAMAKKKTTTPPPADDDDEEEEDDEVVAPPAKKAKSTKAAAAAPVKAKKPKAPVVEEDDDDFEDMDEDEEE